MAARARTAVGASLVLAFVVCLPTSIDSARWWRSPRVVHQLRLTAEQQSAVERIYEASFRERQARAREANAAQRRLMQLLESDAPEPLLEEAASQAADADATSRRLRSLMLYRMARVLSPAQRAKLAALANNRRARRILR